MTVWVITEDLLYDENDGYPSHEGVSGPRGATEAQVAECLLKGDWFEMYDDDGELYYRGRVLGDNPFAPLDDFGTPNAGCTRIKVNGEEV